MTKQATAIVFQAGQTPKMAVDGKKNALAVTPGSPAGTTSVSDTLEWGKGGRGTIGLWNGRAALLLLKAGGMSDAEMESMTAALVDPRKVYSVGAANQVTDPNRSPIAQPVFATATAGTPKDINVAAAAYDPNGDPMTATDVTVVSGAATATVPSSTGGNVRVTGNAGLEQEVVLDFGIKDGGNKRSRGRLYASVSAAPVTGTPKNPPEPTTVAKIRTVGYSRGDGSTQYSTITAALAAAQPGDTVYLDDRDWGAEPTRVTVNGSEGSHVVIRSRTHKGAILRMNIRAVGNYLWWHGLTPAIKPWDPTTYTGSRTNDTYDYAEAYSLALFGHHQIVTRCNIRASNGIWINHATKSNFAEKSTRTNDIAVAYCTFPNDMTSVYGPHCNIYMGSYPENSAGPYNIEVAYNLVSDQVANAFGKNSGYWAYTGNSKPKNNKSGNEARNEFHHNLVNTAKTAALYLKRGANVRYNYLRCTGANDQCLNLRHGGRSSQDGETFYSDVPACYVEGNLFDDGGIKISDTDWVVRFNRFNSGYKDIQLMCGQARDGSEDGEAQSAKRTILVGNSGVNKYVLGFLQPNFHLDAAEGGNVKGVKIYRAGETITATNITASQVEAGDAGYQILDGQPAGTPSITPITKAALTAVCGCDT